MLIYQESNATNKLNVIINATTTAGTTLAADVVLEKTIVSGASTVTTVSADFGPSIKSFNITTVEGETPSSVTYTDNKITINGLNAALGSNSPITTKIELPLTVVSSVAAASTSGSLTVITNGASTTFQVPGWDKKIESLAAGSFIEITGSGDSRTIAVPGLGTAAFKDTDYFLAAGAAVNASSLGGQSPAYYAQASSIVQADWEAESGLAQILHKPTIPAAQVNSDWNASSGISQILNKPTLATVATSGSYDDLTNKPTIPTTYIQSASVSTNTLTLWDQAGTTITFSPEIPDGAIAYAGGHDSVLQKVTSIPGESTVRTNEINTITNFGAVLGERNHLGYTTDDNWSAYTADETHGSNGTAVVGGANVISQTEDAFVFGYKNRTFSAHQSIIGGYKSTVYASESAVFGERHTINGLLYEADGDLKTTTRRLLVYGSGNTVGHDTQDSFIGGQQNTIETYLHWSAVSGQSNTIGHYCSWIDIFGKSNSIGTYVKASTVRGFDNTITSGSSSSSQRTGVYIRGNNCTNNGYDDVYLDGVGLKAVESGQAIFGKWNKGTTNCWFEVGCGRGENTRDTAFAVRDYSGTRSIVIGNTELTEAQLQSLLALI